MSRPTVHEAAGVPAEIAQRLAESFELVDSPSEALGIVTTPAIPVDEAFLDAAGPQLRIVANYAVGLDNVDLAATRERGIVVSNTPGVLTNATAEHAIGLTLALLRRIVEGDRSLRRRDEWEWGPDFMVGEGSRARNCSSSARGELAAGSLSWPSRTALERRLPVAMPTCTPRSPARTSSACTVR